MIIIGQPPNNVQDLQYPRVNQNELGICDEKNPQIQIVRMFPLHLLDTQMVFLPSIMQFIIFDGCVVNTKNLSKTL